MTTEEFEQKLIITLASNPEFIKQASQSYPNKQIWFALSEQMNKAVTAINSPFSNK